MWDDPIFVVDELAPKLKPSVAQMVKRQSVAMLEESLFLAQNTVLPDKWWFGRPNWSDAIPQLEAQLEPIHSFQFVPYRLAVRGLL